MTRARYFVVEWPANTPRYLVRYDPDGLGVPERYNGRGEWFDCPNDVDVVWGGEPARDITEAQANEIIESGRLPEVTPLRQRELEGHY